MSRNAPTGNAPPQFIVFVPGFLGSKLSDQSGKTVWVDFSQIPPNPLQWGSWIDGLFNAMQYPNDDLHASGVIDDVIFASPWIKQEQYSRLIRELESFGYRADPARHAEQDLDVYMFPYDWRQDNRISGRQLAVAVERWSAFHPGAQVWLMAHSNGGLVSRWYIEKEGGKDKVSRLILLASPWDGTAKAMHLLFNGLDMLFRQRFNLFKIPERTRQVLRTFPSIYQLIPEQNQFLRDLDNNVINPWVSTGWVQGEKEQDLLADAHRFHQELGSHLSIETLVFFGRKMPTTTAGTVRLSAGSHWDSVQWLETEAGDGTLPERSAVFADARQNIPIIAGHGDIYVNPALYEILRWELVDQYRGVSKATAHTEKLAVEFNSDCETYHVGDSINLWATVQDANSGKPVLNAAISAQLIWRQPLPGSVSPTVSLELPRVDLNAKRSVPGRYEARMRTPLTEGYYEIRTWVMAPPNKPVELSELIAIESLDEPSTREPRRETLLAKRKIQAAQPKRKERRRTMAKGISLHIGLNHVDPKHYQDENGDPWDGELTACEFDAKDMQSVAKSQGFKTQTLLTQKATVRAVRNAVTRAAKELKKGDIFLVTYSGHGGQVPDCNAEEDDDMDETWCLYDRELIDDELYTLWSEFKPGVRIMMLSDSCHSGTVAKDANLQRLTAAHGKARVLPVEVQVATYKANKTLYDGLQNENPQGEQLPVAASVVLISGCQDNQTSSDGDRNGLFTAKLLAVWGRGEFKGNLREFRKRIAGLMPWYQAPNYFCTGTPSLEFEQQRPFTI